MIKSVLAVAAAALALLACPAVKAQQAGQGPSQCLTGPREWVQPRLVLVSASGAVEQCVFGADRGVTFTWHPLPQQVGNFRAPLVAEPSVVSLRPELIVDTNIGSRLPSPAGVPGRGVFVGRLDAASQLSDCRFRSTQTFAELVSDAELVAGKVQRLWRWTTTGRAESVARGVIQTVEVRVMAAGSGDRIALCRYRAE